MKLTQSKNAVQFSVNCELAAPLLLRSGKTGDFSDSAIERTPDGRLHINGYVWASLIRRSLDRLSAAKGIAETVGAYPEDIGPNDPLKGVSPLWCEAAFVDVGLGARQDDDGLFPTDIRPGNRIDRKWGTVAITALYSDEVLPPGHPAPLAFTYFCDDPEAVEKQLLAALWVIDQGVENIGGGWTYGFGRLRLKRVRTRRLDLTQPEDRDMLWDYDNEAGWTEIPLEDISTPNPDIARPWRVFRVEAGILDGQLMAVQTETPPLDIGPVPEDGFPDTFVFRRSRAGAPASEIVIPGKAIRQALLSVPLERRHRGRGEDVCDGSPQKNGCDCVRCRWFGSTEKRGMASVTDAVVRNPETVFLNRIQLCEHSMQNMNLFTGEFLSKGDFSFDIVLDDPAESETSMEEFADELLRLLDEMTPGHNNAGPPGWHRLGGTSTCTGQVEIKRVTELSANGGDLGERQ